MFVCLFIFLFIFLFSPMIPSCKNTERIIAVVHRCSKVCLNRYDKTLSCFYLKIVDFLRKQEDFVDLMIKHIGTSAIMDLLLRMLTCIEPQQLRQDVLNVGNNKVLPLLC